MRLSNQIGICGFSILCGFVLSSWSNTFVGNFTVWPGKHFDMFATIQSMGGAEPFMENVRKSMDESPFMWESSSKQIEAEPGDFICCHPMLPHRAGPNYSSHIRYAVFMRPTRMDHALHRLTITESDMWVEYEGLNEVFRELQTKANVDTKSKVSQRADENLKTDQKNKETTLPTLTTSQNKSQTKSSFQV
ncbi:hypothetical protein RFI_04069 [Reticulomyxa filosa]|uniref:Phytanoyl-CoA dioxygenase n=1 Tax=Reticulomyxa filosa TaxID=46433 RepID=X6P3C3_RETFI|nr:hypothetical protein RFI_04069 [Reticulomyxa filosa]|eukprot:ETO33040.1 hypothetical protein RFI_04069 [Reticulomyxa filosa]